MMKSLLAANRSEKDSFRIPHSVQQSIPIRRIFTDGIWQVGQKYSKTWRFSDINYAASSLDDRRSIFRSYGAVLNSLPTDATAKITIINRRLNPVDFQRTMLMPECSDGLDYYRGEYNQIILDKAAESNNLVQEKYITFGCPNREATVERLRYVAALTPDPAAKKLFYMLSVKLSDEKCDKWYRRFYYNLRLQMQEYYQHKAVIMDSYWNHHMEKSYGEADEV